MATARVRLAWGAVCAALAGLLAAFLQAQGGQPWAPKVDADRTRGLAFDRR